VVEVEGDTVGAAMHALTDRFPRLRSPLLTSDGRLRSVVAVYVNDEDVRNLQREATPIQPSDELSIVPAIAGGSPGPDPGGTESRLSSGELRRYSRQLLLPEVGPVGQRRLRSGRVVIVGAGGLGSPAALYLVAAGVGTIGLVDSDAVDLSNLHRQVLYSASDVERPKLEAAQQRLQGLNPEVRIETHPGPIHRDNALELLRPYDVIVDGTDNFPARYLLNDAAALLGKPDVFGSVYRFEGQVSVFDARVGPCYRCLFPEPPPPDSVPTCAEGGVLGVLPGIIGLLQATEALKLLLGIGEPLIGRLVLVDALAMRFRELRLRRNPACVLCGPNATQHELIDYPAFCGTPSGGSVPTGIPTISAERLVARLSAPDPPLLLDVREPVEFDIDHLPGARSIPWRELPERIGELTRAREVVLYCSAGTRSARGARLLIDLGVQNVSYLDGGLEAWWRLTSSNRPPP
jgi:adenylyltransferase/sulfurtransferase